MGISHTVTSLNCLFVFVSIVRGSPVLVFVKLYHCIDSLCACNLRADAFFSVAEVEEPTRGREGQSSTSMAVDEAGPSNGGNDSKRLKVRGGIKKRGKSQGRLKKERHHKKKLQF